LKVQAILELPPPTTRRLLQSLQGKVNFLRCFVPIYATQGHGFLHLLWQDIRFQWDEFTQQEFDTLKNMLTSAPLISPLTYDQDYILYISAFVFIVVGVLVQECEDKQ